MKTDTRKRKHTLLARRLFAMAAAFGLVSALTMDAVAQRDVSTKRQSKPNLVPDSVTLGQVFYDQMENNTFKQRYRICVRNASLIAATPPSDVGWWSIIFTFPDDKGGRPNAHYWSRHKIHTSLGGGKSYCFDRDLWITNCRASNPRIRVSADADKGIDELNEDDNRKDYYPPAFCSGG